MSALSAKLQWLSPGSASIILRGVSIGAGAPDLTLMVSAEADLIPVPMPVASVAATTALAASGRGFRERIRSVTHNSELLGIVPMSSNTALVSGPKLGV